ATGNTVFTFLNGNKRKVSDNRDNETTTTYLAYGAPSYSIATFIDAPQGVDTSMQINQFGNITQITQGGLTEYRYYDAYQRLCQSYRADTGKTVYDYNAIGELQWYAEGVSGVTNSCSSADVAASEKVYLTYDNLGRVKYKNFTNTATADIDYYYDPNGNITNINSGPTQWSYKYNTQNQATDAVLKLDGQTFELKYGYDSLGNQSTLTYPSGRQISYAPNVLGQPTKAGEFATGASYHVNGTLTNFTYGNGLKYDLTLNSRQFPEHLKTLKGNTQLSHLEYTYDGNGNTSSIADHKDASYSISMGYDGLDRLTSANGKWGAASFTYDTMGNITGKNLGSMAVSYVYDPTTKRLNSASVTGSKSKSYSFTYDKKGAVTNTGNVQLPRNQAGQVTGTGGHTYVYDGNGKRVKDTKNGKNRYSIYDQPGRMIYQWDQQTETITDYIFLGKELVTEAQVSLGDGSLSVDNTNVGYTGHQWDDDSGLNYMQARYYDPLLARFLNNDPIGFRGIHSFNRYAYATNNPYKYTDPTGQNEEMAFGAGVGIAFSEEDAAVVAAAEAFVGNDQAVNGITAGQGLSDIVSQLSSGASLVSAVGGAVVNRVYDDSTYNKHGSNDVGDVSKAPQDGQAALDESVQIKSTSARRVGVDATNGEVVVLDRHQSQGNTETYHGHVQGTITDQKTRNAANKLAGVSVNKKGKWKVK
ncbi:MAG: RHS repeat-associated core domain-containing protein, partial [Algicola sp.]|nr:RHS repeat-associated core domain-containing protein [Algicola sp.]